jgi:hypothetical protein
MSFGGERKFCTVPPMALRSNPVTEHATLPDGGSVTVWVGVPSDSYVKQSELSTVDIQLHEGDNVLASTTTVLDPAQTSEALALAREVKAAIEAGDIGLHAHDLERFANR